MSIFQISAVMDSSGNQLDTQYSNVRPFVLRLARLLIVMRERERFVYAKCVHIYALLTFWVRGRSAVQVIRITVLNACI